MSGSQTLFTIGKYQTIVKSLCKIANFDVLFSIFIYKVIRLQSVQHRSHLLSHQLLFATILFKTKQILHLATFYPIITSYKPSCWQHWRQLQFLLKLESGLLYFQMRWCIPSFDVCLFLSLAGLIYVLISKSHSFVWFGGLWTLFQSLFQI